MGKQTTRQNPTELEALKAENLELNKKLKKQASDLRSQLSQIRSLQQENEALKKLNDSVNGQPTKAVTDTIERYRQLKLRVSGLGLSDEGPGTWCLNSPQSNCDNIKGSFLDPKTPKK